MVAKKNLGHCFCRMAHLYVPYLCPSINNKQSLNKLPLCYTTLTLDLFKSVSDKNYIGRDGLGTFAAFQMLLAKIGAKICHKPLFRNSLARLQMSQVRVSP